MKRIFSILLALALVLSFSLVATTPVAAATITVPGDYLTIQAAISAASPGDTIVVVAGTYTESTQSTTSPFPMLTTKAATGITDNSATLNMNYTVGDFSPVELRFGYKKSADTAWLYTPWVNKTVAGSHAELLSGLSSGTQYDFKAQLRYCGTAVIEGHTLQFTTLRTPPTVTTRAATGITIRSATLNMNYTVGDFSPVEVRFGYKKSADATWMYTSWVSKTASGSHAEPLSGLSSGTQYDFKAELRYDGTVIEGVTLQFTTLRTPPTVTTRAATGITANSAILNVNYTVGNFSSVEVRFGYKKSADTAWLYTPWVSKTAAGTHGAPVTGLSSSTQYDFKAELRYDGTVIEGVTLQFTTLLALPTVTTKAATDVQFLLATLNMDFTVGEFSPVHVRFAYKQSADTAWFYTAWVSRSADGDYARNLVGLFPGIAYDFKAQLRYDGTVIEGATLQFTTAAILGCFIATAAYGTPSAEEINVLRRFRDVVLLRNTLGSRFVALYCRLSPPVADLIAGNEILRTIVREIVVAPIVWVVEATGNIWRT